MTKLFTITCPECQKTREVSYKTYWYSQKYTNGRCKSCSPKNTAGLEKGRAWNKGLEGFGKGHKPYFIAYGEDNPAWKGNEVGYTALHYWIRRQKGDARKCEECGKEGKCTWANISGGYKRDINDFRSLCYSCHKFFDLRRRNPL